MRKVYRCFGVIRESSVENPRVDIGWVAEGLVREIDGKPYVQVGKTMEPLDDCWKQGRSEAITAAADRVMQGIAVIRSHYDQLMRDAARERANEAVTDE